MKLGWKILIPTSLVWLVLVATLQGVRMWVTDSLLAITGGIVAVFLVVMIILWLFDRPEPEVKADEEFDPFAGGYPVPPLPGQQLPPSPRAGLVPAATAATDQKEVRDE